MAINPGYEESRERIPALEKAGTTKSPAEIESLFDLQFFESLDKVNRVMYGTNDLERMMREVLDAVLSTFKCDRAFLLHACDSEAPSWFPQMERSHPKYPGVLASGTPFPMTPLIKNFFQTLLDTDGPVELTPCRELHSEEDPWKTFEIKSVLAMALYPKTGKPWAFGLHQCSHARIWTGREKKLFQEIGRRLADALTSLLMYRDLQQSEEFLNTIIEHIPSLIFVKDAEALRFVRFNKAGEKLRGSIHEKLIGKNDYDIFPKEKAEHFTAQDREVLNTNKIVDIPEEMIRTGLHEKKLFHTQKIPILDETGKPKYLLGISEDITEHKRAEESLRASEERYRTIFESTATANIIVAEDTTILMANNNFAGLCGYTKQELEGKMSWTVFIHPDDLERMKTYHQTRRIDSGSAPSSYEFRFMNRQGGVKDLFMNVAVIPETKDSVASMIDLTGRKQLETQLIQAQKMESVGRLAGGVAHDFNNMLSVIIGNAEMAINRLKDSDPLQKPLQEILNAGMRSSDLTRQLLAFARKQTVSPKVLDLNDTVTGMLKMLRRLIGEDIDLGWHPGHDLWKVKIDPSQVDQLLANLTVNARDAITKTGRIVIETSNMICDEAYCAGRTESIPGEYVMLVVSDDGCGMGKETLANIFEPFFTTKKEGQGTGLGLATVYGIVKQNNGFINVYSEPDKGTTLRIYLPRCRVESMETADDKTELEVQGGTETILIVEDSETVLKICKSMLEALGYKVLAAKSKDQALRLVEEYDGKIDLLLTDVVMPDMNGKELSERIVAVKPDIKCLYMSGYTADVIARQGILDEGIKFLPKPFSLRDLAAKVRNALV